MKRYLFAEAGEETQLQATERSRHILNACNLIKSMPSSFFMIVEIICTTIEVGQIRARIEKYEHKHSTAVQIQFGFEEQCQRGDGQTSLFPPKISDIMYS